MKFIIASVHLDQDWYISMLLRDLGHEVYFLEDGISYNMYNRSVSNSDGNVSISYEEFLRMDDKDMVIVSQCAEHEDSVYEKMVNKKPGAYVVHNYGNNITESDFRQKRTPKNMIPLDVQSERYHKARGCNNICTLRPGVMSDYAPTPINFDSKPVINCYVQGYVHFPYTDDFNMVKDIQKELKDEVQFNFYGSDSDGGFLMSQELLKYPLQGFEPTENKQLDAFHKSWMTIHIKKWEGYGFNIVKSMHCARPVIACSEYIQDKTLKEILDKNNSLLISKNNNSKTNAQIIRDLINDKNRLNIMATKAWGHVTKISSYERNINKLRVFISRLEK